MTGLDGTLCCIWNTSLTFFSIYNLLFVCKWERKSNIKKSSNNIHSKRNNKIKMEEKRNSPILLPFGIVIRFPRIFLSLQSLLPQFPQIFAHRDFKSPFDFQFIFNLKALYSTLFHHHHALYSLFYLYFNFGFALHNN